MPDCEDDDALLQDLSEQMISASDWNFFNQTSW